jgi:integrase
MSMKLTVNSVAALKLPKGQHDKIIFDDAVAGFGIRMRDRGSYWIFQYAISTNDRRIQRRMTFGTYPAMSVPKARARVEELHAAVRLGRDPAGEKAASQARAGETFKACLDLYLGRRRNEGKLRASTYGEIERHLDRNLSVLHGLQIHNVDRRAIAIELGRLTSESGPVQANRTRASLVKFLNWCAGEGYIDANPAQFTNKNPEAARDRVLVNAELKKIWHALPVGDYGDVVKLLMLTAARANEIAQLRWSEIDFDRGIIALPASRTKNRRAHFIPISVTVRTILEARQHDDGRDFVFGRGQGGFSGWSRSKNRLDDDVRIPAFTIHDIRRAVATGMGEIGVQPHVVEAVLNHVSGSKAGVAGRYNKSQYETEKTNALARWDEHLMTVVGIRKTTVTPLKRSQRGG